MSRLPTLGGDTNSWGSILNDYLQQSLTNAGLLVTSTTNSYTGNPNTNLATSSQPGLVQLATDLGGTAAAPTVVATSLSSALPINQGGTGSTTQNFVDLTTNQSIAGTKTFTGEVIVPTPVNATDAVTNAYAVAMAAALGW